MRGPSELSIAKVAGILSQSRGMTVKEIIDGLGVSRQTAIRWLTLMENGGLLYKTHKASGMKGRPTSVYHPTVGLSDFLKSHHHRSSIMVDFPLISAICRFNSKGYCELMGRSRLLCEMEICPLLNGPLL